MAKKAQRDSYLHPHVCLACRKSFKLSSRAAPARCPDCAAELVVLNRKFAAPPRRDRDQWEKIAYLIDHGFRFQSVYGIDGQAVSYPSTLAEAKRFVVEYADQARSR